MNRSAAEPSILAEVLTVLTDHPTTPICNGATVGEHERGCPAMVYAIREDQSLVHGDFDCLRCRYTFRRAGAAHIVGTGICGTYAFCACDWAYMRANPGQLAQARRMWRIEGMTFSPEERRSQHMRLASAASTSDDRSAL